MLAIAGCLTPPGPPNQNETTPTPTPSKYVESGAGISYQEVYNTSKEQLNKSEGFAVTYNVTIKDPRLSSEEKSYIKQYLMNVKQNETLYQSNFSSVERSVYKDSVLYYERTGGRNTQAQTTVTPISEVENDTVTMEEAAGNSSLIKTGLDSSQYSFTNVSYQNNEEISTYTASQSVSNYDASDLIPSDMNYQFGNPEITGGSENIESEVRMTKDGLMRSYTLTYSATMFVDGTEEDFEMQIKYTVNRNGPTVGVDKPGWVQNTSQQG